jgi:hypothetical protein
MTDPAGTDFPGFDVPARDFRAREAREQVFAGGASGMGIVTEGQGKHWQVEFGVPMRVERRITKQVVRMPAPTGKLDGDSVRPMLSGAKPPRDIPEQST